MLEVLFSFSIANLKCEIWDVLRPTLSVVHPLSCFLYSPIRHTLNALRFVIAGTSPDSQDACKRNVQLVS